MLSLALAVSSLSACKAEVSPEEQARQDARDIAQVEAAQHAKPPPQAIHPEPISEGDIAANDLAGAGCAFTAQDAAGMGPLLMFNDKRASLKLDGRITYLAADSGSAQLDLGSREHYVGKRYDLRIIKAASAAEPGRRGGSVIVRDAWDQIVFRQDGTLECGV